MPSDDLPRAHPWPFLVHTPRTDPLSNLCGTCIAATSIAVYGLLMRPLSWAWTLFVWGYAVVWLLVNDRVTLLAYPILDPPKARTPSDSTPQIATRAYELYEQRGRQESRPVQDGDQAEREIRKDELHN
jgi:H+-transporting ATPase